MAGRFVDGHYGTLRGRVCTYVIASHLREHLPAPPATLVDVGVGAGNQSIPLARAGYQVTIVDPSAAMLERARSRLAAGPGEVAGRVRLVQASAGQARHALGGERFAGVLCHGVIMYVEDPRPFTAALADLAQPGAILSVVAKNAAALATKPALEGDWAGALAAVMDWLRKRGSYFQATLETDIWHTPSGDQPVHFWREPLSALCTAATDAGFLIEKPIEPVPAETMRERYSEDYEKLSREPGFLILRLLKPATPNPNPPS